MPDTTNDPTCLLPWEEEQREIIIKKKATSDPKFGCLPYKRSVDELIANGIVNINKPQGPSSHQVSAYIQTILGISKAGHSGTLDPHVTGCLPIALENSTRITQALLTSGKEYICLMHLHQTHTKDVISKTIEDFRGTIHQLPPVRSAVKRAWRERLVYYFNILEINNRDVLFVIGCQAGTYIRKLVHDIGQQLGSGAHMQQLIRTKAGPFNYKTMWTLQDVRDAYWYAKHGNEHFIRQVILPIESAITHLAHIWVLDSTVESLCHGATLGIPGISMLQSGIETGDTICILTLKGELIGIGTAQLSSTEISTKEKGLAACINKVFMKPGTYPRIGGVK